MRLFLKITGLVLSITAIIVGLFALAVFAVPLPERLNPPASTVIAYQGGRPAHVFLAADDRWRILADHRQVDPAYIEALLALEDKRFFSHPGVDIWAILRAMKSNFSRGRVVSGASTLTMQVVRMAEPRPRTLASKMVEAFRAIQIEQHYSKAEILDIYLSLLPYGGNYEGVETAALAYFGHDASSLSPAQIATLLAVPQAPSVRHPSPDNAGHLRAARDAIAARLLEQGALPRGMRSERLTIEEALSVVRETEVPVAMRPMPREIPHLAYQMRREYPRAPRLELAVDRATQHVVEAMVAQHRQGIEELGADHVAVVVMDHHTGELKAAVGNFDYSLGVPGMTLPAFDISRSSGSLLKPFLLARAIDEGLAAPSHRVVDIPVNFGGYRPQNFDGSFEGLVSLEDALSRSLNIPFVNLLNEVGTEEFLTVLHQLGVPYPSERIDEQGLSVAVGGVAITPVQVAELYSALARRGDAATVQRLSSGGPQPMALSRRGALSAESTWLVRQILRRRERPGFAGRARIRGDARGTYAWKTGTSMGHRDAWTAGFGPRYVVVVWAGNLDHRPGRGLVGERAVAPLFFDIIEAIDPTKRAQYQAPPDGLHSVEVCAFSGHLPTAACEHTTQVELPKKSVPTRPCPYHVEVDVDVATGQALTRACQGDREVETRTFLSLPSQVLRYFDPTGARASLAPSFAPGCRLRPLGTGPSVISPPRETTIVLIAGLPAEAQQIPLQASVEGGGELNWFVDGRFIGQVRDGQRLWWQPRVGDYEFVVTDSHGRAARRMVEVR